MWQGVGSDEQEQQEVGTHTRAATGGVITAAAPPGLGEGALTGTWRDPQPWGRPPTEAIILGRGKQMLPTA